MRPHLLTASLLVAFWVVISSPPAAGRSPTAVLPPATDTNPQPPQRLVLHDPTVELTLKLHATQAKLRREHARYLQAHRRVVQLGRVLRQRPTTREAMSLACTIYGNCSTLWRIARCESGVYPLARNPSGASGLFQFMPGTFAGTPFGGLSIWSPYANALAAGWMFARGRASAWVCR